MTNNLGIDIGGVIIDRANDKTDTSFFSDNYLKSKSTENCTTAIRRIVDSKKFSNIYLVSKARTTTQRKTKEWLRHNLFFQETGIHPDDVYFCFERSDKAEICNDLDITHFIDDKMECLRYMEDIVPVRYLFNPTIKEATLATPNEIVVYSWDELILREYGNDSAQ